MSLVKNNLLHLSGDPTVSSTGCGNRPKHQTLLDLPLDKAIAIQRSRAEAYVTHKLAPISKIQLRKIGPLTYSLESIKNGDTDNGLKLIFKPSTAILENKQTELLLLPSAESSDQSKNTAIGTTAGNITPEYPNCTPYQAVSYLADKGMPINILIGHLNHLEDQTDQSHKWRCMIYSGDINVMVDSIRKQVARDMASVKFLERLAQMNKHCKIPKYTILPELFIDPRIFHMLEKEARQRGLHVGNWMTTKQVKMTNRKEDGNDGDYVVACVYVSTYIIDKAVYKGESFVEEYAKLIAAKRSYEDLTKTEVAPTKYFTGGLCDPSVEYDFGKSEIHQMSGNFH